MFTNYNKITIFTDIDGTARMERKSTTTAEQKAIYDLADAQFYKFIQINRDKINLVYVSGRAVTRSGDVQSVEEMVQDGSLIMPDFVVGDAGSEIFNVVDGKFVEWDRWQTELGQFDHAAIETTIALSLVDGYIPGTATRVEKQPENQQGRHKQSYFLYNDVEGGDNTPASQHLIKELQIHGKKAIWSSNRDFDVVSGIKSDAVNYLIKGLGLDPEQCIVAGDSGNDIALINESHAALAIIPGNAHKQLVDTLSSGQLEKMKANGGEMIFTASKAIFVSKELGPAALVEGIKTLYPKTQFN